MTIPPLTAVTTQLVVSRIADADFDQLGVCPGDGKFRDRRRIVVDAIRRSAQSIDEFRETQFLARTTVEGREVVLLKARSEATWIRQPSSGACSRPNALPS
jgi:hypothetical protein